MSKTIECKDMIGQTITEGAWVVFNPAYIKGTCIGRVYSFTEKTVRIKYNQEGIAGKQDSQSNRRAAEVIVISKQLEDHREHYPEMYV